MTEERPEGSGHRVTGEQWTQFKLNDKTKKIEFTFKDRFFGDDKLFLLEYRAEYLWTEGKDKSLLALRNFEHLTKEGWKATPGRALMTVSHIELTEDAKSLFFTFDREETHFLKMGHLRDNGGLTFKRVGSDKASR